jgi:hypothetical protein
MPSEVSRAQLNNPKNKSKIVQLDRNQLSEYALAVNQTGPAAKLETLLETKHSSAARAACGRSDGAARSAAKRRELDVGRRAPGAF